MDLIEIGQLIKKTRKELGLSQETVAKRADTSRNTLEALENGRAPDTGFKTVLGIMNVVGLDLRPTTLNAGRPTIEDIARERDEEAGHAPRMG